MGVQRFAMWCLSILPMTVLTACGSGYYTSPATIAAERIFDSQLNAGTVFMGDSITYRWPLPIHNAGVPGQYTGNMLSRFQTDVLGHGYVRVVILGGTNDIWFNTGAPGAAVDQAVGNIAAMAALGKSAGMQVFLCTVPPLNSGGIDRTGPITQLNDKIRKTAAQEGYFLADYYPSLLNHTEYFADGVHPNETGYEAMHAVMSLAVTR